MPIMGLVLTFAPPIDAARSTFATMISQDDRITIGPPSGHRQPIVVETTSIGEDRRLLKTLEELPMVSVVEIAFIDFSDLTEVESSSIASADLRKMGSFQTTKGTS